MIPILLLLQSTPADIELNLTARAQSVTIEQQGDARLTVTSEPDGGNVVGVQAPRANGRKQLDNVEVRVRAEARLARSPNQPAAGETEPPQ